MTGGGVILIDPIAFTRISLDCLANKNAEIPRRVDFAATSTGDDSYVRVEM
jgi:hypothetical protein